MNPEELCDVEAQTQMHPALDVVGNTLYLTVRVGTKKSGVQDIILTSSGDMLAQDEWQRKCAEWGLIPTANATLRSNGPRWNNKSIIELKNGTMVAPTWEDAYSKIYEEMDARLQVNDPKYLAVLTLYAMMTYFHPLFDFLPILHLRGPAGSGKTRAGTIVGYVSFNGAVAGRSTTASVFRDAHEGRYTQVITEADHLAMLDSGNELVQQFQAGCSKSEAWVVVTEGGKGLPFQTARYYIFNPRILLSTKHFKSHPLRSRCIRLDLTNTTDTDETKLRKSKDVDAIWSPLRDKMYRLLLRNWRDVQEAQERLKDTWRGTEKAKDDTIRRAPKGRTFEKWLPLATIASLVSDEVLDVVKELASEDQKNQQEDAEDTFEAILFKFAEWVTKKGDSELKEEEIYDDHFRKGAWSGIAARPETWDTPNWARETDTPVTYEQLDRWIKTKRALVKELKRLNLIPKEPRHDREKGNLYLFSKNNIEKVVGAYLGSDEGEEEKTA